MAITEHCTVTGHENTHFLTLSIPTGLNGTDEKVKKLEDKEQRLFYGRTGGTFYGNFELLLLLL